MGGALESMYKGGVRRRECLFGCPRITTWSLDSAVGGSTQAFSREGLCCAIHYVNLQSESQSVN